MDKREFPRYDKDIQVACTPLLKITDEDFPSRILNISLGGVYMLSESVIEKDTSLNLTFSVNRGGTITTLATKGSVLRSGRINDEPEMIAKYNLGESDRSCFAVIKFEAPFIELSFMLH